mmetsp:Transcript_27250/g.44252  ORF Transcript_27250/g.44252 Transcript_27250/m.44252 type:complete len:236 (-) Transcript_27250:440-1147(-)
MRIRGRTSRDALFVICRFNHFCQIQITAMNINRGNFFIPQLDKVPRIISKCGRVAGNESSVIANTNVEWRSMACNDQLLGVIGAHQRKTIRSLQTFHSLLCCVTNINFTIRMIVSNQFGNHFCISLSIKFVPQLLQLITQRLLVKDGSIVNYCNFSRRISVRMGILISDTSNCSPAGMSNTDTMSWERIWGSFTDHFDGILFVVSAGFFNNVHSPSRGFHRCHSCTIISASLYLF